MKTYFYFSFFGLVSTPALSNLIIKKIDQMKKKDFIVALKLLGISDMQIIIKHMLLIYCKPVIIFQSAYILAHSFFLDITLCYMEKVSQDSNTFGYYIYKSYTDSWFKLGQDYIYVTLLAFFITFIFYSIADSFKQEAA